MFRAAFSKTPARKPAKEKSAEYFKIHVYKGLLNMAFDKIKNNFGFGCMRLKMTDGEVDYSEFDRMLDRFIGAGFNYFDTAHGYIGGKSETAIRDCLSARYNREDFVLANKLSYWLFEKEEDIIPLFESQLKACGVDYFDFYIFHALNREAYLKHKKCNSFEVVKGLKAAGRIKHIAISFHDSADVLDMILTEQPSVEAVQLQLNYLDYDDPTIQSRACYDVAVKHGKKVMVMEPVKGGVLVNLPKSAADELDSVGASSPASFALRFAASFPAVFMVLSGMGSVEMVEENIKTFSDFTPFSEAEFSAAERARAAIRRARLIPCTACGYCTDVCPKSIRIPEIFATYNEYLQAKIARDEARKNLCGEHSAADCIKCGKCEKICPQSIEVRRYLEDSTKL